MKTLFKKIILIAIVCTIFTCCIPFSYITYAKETPTMKIYAMYLESNDKGESVLIESNGNYLLMDLGSYGNVNAIIRQLNAIGVKKINLYLSHLHMDHYGGSSSGNVTAGIIQLQNSGIEIQKMYLPDPSIASEAANYNTIYKQFENFMKNKPVEYLKKGSSFTLGNANVNIIGPLNTDKIHPDDYIGVAQTDDSGVIDPKNVHYENNCSLVAKITCDKVTYLSTGDILEDQANELVKLYGSSLRADILKLSHHGTGSGNTEKLINAVQPSYTFAQNTNLTGISSKTKKWYTNISRKRSTMYGMCYLIANERKTLIYEIKNNQIHLYENSINPKNMLKGWVRLTGGDGEFRKIDRYYFDNTGKPLTGVQKIAGHYYYFGKGGCMEYGNFTENGKYQGWKTYDDGKRYYIFSPDKEFAHMAYGFTKAGKETYYFNSKGHKVEGKTATVLKKIGKYEYAIGISGAITINNWSTIGKDKYYFDNKGRMVKDMIVKIGSSQYYFGHDGKMLRSKKGEKKYITFKKITYQVGTSGALKKV